MKTDDFNYELPEELIAQTPIAKRDASRLMVLDRKTGEITHDIFHNIINYLDKDDVLVLNDTKVMPARIIGEKIDIYNQVMINWEAFKLYLLTNRKLIPKKINS